MSRYVIGIDGGTQSSKVSIFDLAGNEICSAVQKLKPLNMPSPGVAEHPDDDIWDSIASACKRAMAAFPYAPESIIGIGLCTIRCCIAELNKDGELASPILNWMDQRVGKVYSWSNPEVRYVTTTSGYIGFRLTGSKNDTAANYEGQWPLDKHTWQWSDDDALIEQFKLPRESLFELIAPGEVLGLLTDKASLTTGLPIGVPVVATANDKAVEALGVGLTNSSTALVSLGTYIGAMVSGPKHIDHADCFFSNLASVPKQYLYECAGIRHGMGSLSWLIKLFGDSIVEEAALQKLSAEELLNSEAGLIEPGCEGLVTLPEWLAPYDKIYKRGAMLGFHPGHTRAHLYRSMLEAIALTMKNNCDAMQHELSLDLDEIIISGGGSNSDVFMQIFADVFELPVRRTKVNGAASLGAGICAAVAVKAFDSFESAVQAMVQVGDRVEPNSNNALFYATLNTQVFKDLSEYIDPIFQKNHNI